MINREQKVKELIEDLHAIKRVIAFHTPEAINIHRITPSQWMVLMFIEQNKESNVKDIAKALAITSSAATQLVDGLVESGYLFKKSSLSDKRTVVIGLSKNTEEHVKKMKKECLHKSLKLFEVLNDKEFSQYILFNKKIIEKI
jgi:DNA-binding MarR family transcriptional regulator